MKVQVIQAGMNSCNCYVVTDENQRGFIVDPGDGDYLITDYIDDNAILPEFILLTHGHVDHIGAVKAIKEHYGIPVLAGAKERRLLGDGRLNLSSMIGAHPIVISPDQDLHDGERYSHFDVEVIATPGHTAGGVCYKVGEVLFSGDTLFEQSIGRSDLPTGNSSTLLDAIRSKLFTLPENTLVYPGHGPSTTIGDEIRYNPFF